MKLLNQDIDLFSVSYMLTDSIDFFRNHSWRQNLNMLRFLVGHKKKPIHVSWNPIRITVGIEYRCNLHCVFCPWHSKDRTKPILPFKCTLDDVKRILEYFVSNDLAHVHYCATGETTLNKDLPSMVRYAHQQGLTTSFMSNFSRVVTKKLDEIAELPLWKVYGDLDTGDPVQFESMRPGHSWKVLCNNISYLAKRRDQVGNHFDIGVYSLMMKNNYHTFKDIMRTAADIGVDSVQMVYLAPADFNEVSSVDNAVYNEDIEVVEYLKEARDYGRKLGLRIYLNPFASRIFDGGGITTCDNLWWKLFVNMASERLPKEKQLGNVSNQCEISMVGSGYSYGNLFDDGFGYCWNGPKIKLLRRQLLHDPPPICRRCPGR